MYVLTGDYDDVPRNLLTILIRIFLVCEIWISAGFVKQ